ncbi:hypothetical protein [Galactobacter caseinivorans]|nr:hypothetical protein [Galactobacter caseinivorans]
MFARIFLLAIACAVAGGYLLKVDEWAAWLAFAGSAVCLGVAAVRGLKLARRRHLAQTHPERFAVRA